MKRLTRFLLLLATMASLTACNTTNGRKREVAGSYSANGLVWATWGPEAWNHAKLLQAPLLTRPGFVPSPQPLTQPEIER